MYKPGSRVITFVYLTSITPTTTALFMTGLCPENREVSTVIRTRTRH